MTTTTFEEQLGDVDYLGVWYELERALEGKNRYGGDVAQIYAFRLIAPKDKDLSPAERSVIAGRNLTRIFRRFVELHEGVEIGLETDPRKFAAIDPYQDVARPFMHRLNVQVTRVRRTRGEFARMLVATLNLSRELDAGMECFVVEWQSATTNLARELGVRWDPDQKEYVLDADP